MATVVTRMSVPVTGKREEDLEQLYEQVRQRLRACASRFVGWDDAEDVVQEAFVRVLACPGSFRGDASATTWMTRIVVNAAIDETRRRKRRPGVVVAPSRVDLECGVTPNHAQWLELKAAFAVSKRSDRQVLLLAGLLGLSYRETAQRLGISVGSAKSRLCNARCRLRRAMDTGENR